MCTYSNQKKYWEKEEMEKKLEFHSDQIFVERSGVSSVQRYGEYLQIINKYVIPDRTRITYLLIELIDMIYSSSVVASRVNGM